MALVNFLDDRDVDAIKAATKAMIVADIPCPPGPVHALPMLWSALRGVFRERYQPAPHDEAFRMCLLASVEPPHADREDIVADHRERYAALWAMKSKMAEAMDLIGPEPAHYAIIIRGPLVGVENAAAWLPDNIIVYCYR